MTKVKCESIEFTVMSKFSVLKSNQEFMSRLGLYSYRLTETTFELSKSVFAYFMILFLVMGISLSIIYVVDTVKNDMSDVKKLVEALVVIIAGCQTLPAFLAMAFRINEIKALHLKLQSIVDAG